jgi:hypothetical protein
MKWTMAWIYYAFGDTVSRTFEPVFGRWFEWPDSLYNWLMTKSSDWQGPSAHGPWSELEPIEDIPYDASHLSVSIDVNDDGCSGPN